MAESLSKQCKESNVSHHVSVKITYVFVCCCYMLSYQANPPALTHFPPSENNNAVKRVSG